MAYKHLFFIERPPNSLREVDLFQALENKANLEENNLNGGSTNVLNWNGINSYSINEHDIELLFNMAFLTFFPRG